MRRFAILVTAALAATCTQAAHADQAQAVADDARVLLAHSVRASGIDPARIRIGQVRVQGDESTVQWSALQQSGTLSLHRMGSRWIVATDGAPSAAPPATSIAAGGGVLAPSAVQTGGYGFTLRYSANDAAPGAAFTFVYGRLPTPAEFLPFPTAYPITADSVFYFDLTANARVRFSAGSTLLVWMPFVLDDRLHYDLFIDGAAPSIGPIGSSVYDNTVQFALPSLALSAHKTITGEIDGEPH